ncbi:caspase family protein [Streptomyces chengbuensis]|uniref:caspase family protein n=1 Tax=Streptomyces chengbuensis TaxID=3053466 RepID=UPI0025B5C0C4|nr:caspase family protein [Streptomyces sp. HUAS CB01]WJY53595.1 caspase family protein [Streptomyces sp. HUAS CB01]
MTIPHGRYALIVAIETYSDQGLRSLKAPGHDADELVEVLGEPAVGGFEVTVVKNPDSYELRRKTEDFFADRSLHDTLLVHVACHGLKNPGGKLYLAATDTRRDRLASTAVPADYVSGLMMSTRAQRVALMLDCCYAGAFERGMFSRADAQAHVQDSFTGLERTIGERGRAVLTASSAVEYAFEGDRLVASEGARSLTEEGRPGPSLFTGALVEGMRTGAADLNGDGEIGLSELAEYISQRIRRITPHQNPQLWMFGAQGDLSIGKAPRRAAQPAALPSDLAAAVVSPERERRLWAVTDLGAIARGPNMALARTACARLAELRQDDSRRVSEAAENAWAAIQPQVSTTQLDLGSSTAGTPGPAVLLPVDGPPVVRGTLEAIAEPWLRVRYLPEGLTLSLDATASAGSYTGVVKLQTAVGNLLVHVTATVTAERGTGNLPRNGLLNGRQHKGAREPKLAQAASANRRLVAPFVSGAVAMTMAMVLPTHFIPGAYAEDPGSTYYPFETPIGITSAVCVLMLVVVTSLVLETPEACRHRALRVVYNVVTSAALFLGILLAYALAFEETELRAGSFFFAAGCVTQLWGAFRLRHRSHRPTGG